MTVRLKQLRTLRLDTPSAPGRGRFISAASGLVAVGPWLYVIADDELQLGAFAAAGSRPGSLVRLLPGTLPKGKKRRKAEKPDFEVLALLPRFPGFPHGALLAMGSGSRPNRRRGVLVSLGPSGAIDGDPQVIDLSGLYRELGKHLDEVNVEGAVVLGAQLCLLNRGHPRRGGSAVARLSLRAVQRSIARTGAVEALRCKVHHYDLGEADGVPLGFTDGTVLPDGSLVFSAVAEHAENSYEDGPCRASGIGMIGSGGDLEWLHRLRPPRKVEGITARRTGRQTRLLLVTDADDAAVPAGLFDAALPATAATRKTPPSRR
ncbi:MAG: hypothetical protein ABL989_12505 [Gammaproteobacteria bacterium]